MILLFYFSESVSYLFYFVFSLVLLGISISLIISVFHKNDLSSRLTIAGSIVFMMGALGNMFFPLLNMMGLNFSLLGFYINFLFFAVPVELFFFSAALAFRLRQDERDKIRVQEALIAKLKENSRLSEQIQGIRDRVARDLHDDIGATLSSIALYSEVARMDESVTSSTQSVLEKIAVQAREMVGRMSDVVWAIQPRNDGMKALISRMDDAAANLLNPAGIRWQMHRADDFQDIPLTPDQRKNILLIFREAINNTARHSKAQNVDITIHNDPHLFSIKITDDGKGFDTGTASVGNGLQSMKARADECGAKFSVTSSPGNGTRLTFILKF
ncbi:MAG: histidine kinase [Bacteroidia bacterium]